MHEPLTATQREALAGGHWLREVPAAVPLLVETLCEQCTGAGHGI